MTFSNKAILALLLLSLLLISPEVYAAEGKGILNSVSDRFYDASRAWSGVISNAAQFLFFSLAAISLAWNFGNLLLRGNADLGSFLGELIRFIVVTGFFYWLLQNGPNFALAIIDSLRKLGAQASGNPMTLAPSEPLSIAFGIVEKAVQAYSITSPIDNLTIFFSTLAIVICMAAVAANMLLALITAWVIINAGVFVLGFGGAKWTSDIALGYFRSVAAIGMKLLTMTLLIGIATSVLDSFYISLKAKPDLEELFTVFMVAFVLAVVVHSVPNIIAGLIPGGSGAASAGSHSVVGLAGAAVGAAAAVSTGGAALGAATVSAAGAGQALNTAFRMSGLSKGSQSSSSGSFSKGSAFGPGSPFSPPRSIGRMASILSQQANQMLADGVADRVSRTAGGKLAASMRASLETESAEGMGNSLGGASNKTTRLPDSPPTAESLQAEIDRFVNGTKG
ncbi:MAG: P-type conjugative transfer protein TrbL [Burkholderiaceae bacterium]|nr:P-type conjugative transfer protein TrbL [Burkholderiaceae bacterium]